MIVYQHFFPNPFQTRIEPKSVRQDQQGRFYELPSGHFFPSVTTFLKQFDGTGLKEWRERIGEEKANEISRVAAARGEALHSLVERYLLSQPIKAMAQEAYALRMFRAMLPELKRIDNTHLLESFLYSEKLKLAGRVDCVAEFDGKLSIIDFKSASRPKQETWIENYFLQATCYAEMYEERYGIPVEQIVVLIANIEDGKCQKFVRRKLDYLNTLIDRIGSYYGVYN
jgi:ATP-dependent exoDNAse (exonuclease V) beta subunit